MNFDKVIEISYALIDEHITNQRCKHFSFIFDKNRLVSIGMNSLKTHPWNLKFNYINKQKINIRDIIGTHSELNAVLKIPNQNCYGLTMINTRINKKNEIDYSKPCNGCMDMIKTLGFKKVYFTTKNKNFEFIDVRTKFQVA